MIDSVLQDKVVLAAVILAAVTGVYGVFKLKRLNIKNSGSILTDDQSDSLVIGVFHILICAISICCLL
ncbi:hypothetical protein [Mucilaginibacter sp. SP1R1]|uniref:hypothetical protein n=1 Tax=Mucilaginibacter sp. SP1R1 TaxID=2723091 RepID=UPI00161D3D3A|nr:hypothetical protein [Mucilaginibacter sp. SP1R1]MBB6149840.1 hypothetical protein [Mucilaginibacter sp. SP1R1]